MFAAARLDVGPFFFHLDFIFSLIFWIVHVGFLKITASSCPCLPAIFDSNTKVVFYENWLF